MKLLSLLIILTYLLHADISVLSQFTEPDIKKEIQEKGLKQAVIEMAKGTNDKVASQGGYIAVDYMTKFISARANNDTYISYIEISKDAYTEMVAKKSNMTSDETKIILEKNDYKSIREHVKSNLKNINTKRYCSTKEFKLFMKNGIKMKFVYSFDDGGLIDMHTITYESCPNKTTETPSIDKPAAISTQDTADMNSTTLDMLKSAKEGNVSAQYKIGKFYDDKKNYKKAFKWFTLATNQGDANAAMALAGMYRFGKGVSQNSKKSFDWTLVAAEGNNHKAQAVIGLN